MAEELVITPGGYRSKSLVHLIEPGHVVSGEAGRLQKLHLSGKVVAELGPAKVRPGNVPLMPHNVFVPAEKLAAVPALASGWITYADWSNNTGSPITSFRTTWVVPPPPATSSGQVIFLFNGIQNSSFIFQPVLQWGQSAAGGGNFWAVASWYVDGPGGLAIHSSLVQVNPGDVLIGIMTLIGQSGGFFNYNSIFQGKANSQLAVNQIPQLTWCAETLEAYGLTKCSDYPASCKTAMTAIEIRTTAGQAPLNWQAVNAVTDCRQHTVIVTNGSPNGEVDLYYGACYGNKVTLGDTSPKSPSLASLGGRLFLGWKGDGNDNLNVMYSADNGRTFGHKFTSGETSPQAPALCSDGVHLHIAWKGDGNDNLNVAQVQISGTQIIGFTGKVTLSDTSPVSPTLASLNNRLYIGWKGDGNDFLNVMDVASRAKYTSPETSPQPPALCVHNGHLYIAWKGDGNDNLNVARVQLSGTSPINFISKVTLGDTSPVSPTLASINNLLYIGWKGDGNDFLNTMSSADHGLTFGGKCTSSETSPQPPALCSHNGHLYIAWKGDGNDFLNVAQLC
jgi:hypothetical protein